MIATDAVLIGLLGVAVNFVLWLSGMEAGSTAAFNALLCAVIFNIGRRGMQE